MVDDWVRLAPDGIVEVRSGKVELGQGVLTALAQIVAEELDVDVAAIRMTAAATGVSPNEGYTAGSLSIQHSGAALRMAAAEARAALLEEAARRWDVTPDALTVTNGVVTTPDGRSVAFWDVAHADLLHRRVTGVAPTKAASERSVVGTRVPRVDLPDKVAGRPRFAHDLHLPGMVYGRVVRPPSRAAALRSVDTAATLASPGVLTVVRDGDFLAVVAEREEAALRAVERLRADAVWDERATLPDESDLPAFLTSAPAVETVIADDGGNDPVADGGNEFHEARYDRPYLAHASMGPSTATALVTGRGDDARLTVWTHSQGVYLLRRELSRALDVAESRIVVLHVPGAGCYGHNGADDVALDAALLALAVPGRPVQVVWSRPDELGWAPFGPAAVVRIAAEVDQDGAVLRWRHDVWGNGHVTRPGFVDAVGLLAASHRRGGQQIAAAGEPPLANGGGASRNAVPGYAFPRTRVVNHLLSVMPLRTSALRSLGAFVNVFAIESFMDELAVAAGRDPVEYRLAHLEDPRGRAVLEAAAQRAGWAQRVAVESRGVGVAYARYKNTSAYCAVVAEVEATSEVRVRRLVVVVDAGLVVNPDGAENQIEGGAIQATSWALKERVRFDDRSVTSDTWETYPILTFSEVPSVDVELMPDGGNPSLGVGETAQGPTVAAIANAIYDAIGVRVRSLPFTPDRIVAAMPD
ncbi:xanthine dehydrogenase family protein molybdopterin-binding subunit [Mycobacterium yunnanensis]|uniref:Xanthine dehydrogenase family protein molybdopterin-binding subunit n=2 Tax=Mycobacterium yunnanensis TaxID=368477 RepID=A0A9X3C2D5_9MYCO|nr:xanthine dehydrogenase family protein molybdopterin-binding subunit [Mycobacterium yunnanensis]